MESDDFCIWSAITHERRRQEMLARMGRFKHTCAHREMSDGARLTVLVEEVGEVARALHDEEPLTALRAELVQTAAVCVAWLESMGHMTRRSP